MRQFGIDNGPELERLMDIYHINAFEYRQYKRKKETFAMQPSKLHGDSMTPQAITKLMAIRSTEETDGLGGSPSLTHKATAAARTVVQKTIAEDAQANVSFVIKKKTLTVESPVAAQLYWTPISFELDSEG